MHGLGRGREGNWTDTRTGRGRHPVGDGHEPGRQVTWTATRATDGRQAADKGNRTVTVPQVMGGAGAPVV